jgi:hypothetical protein
MVTISLGATRSPSLVIKHSQRSFSTSLARREARGSATDPRFSRLGTLIEDKFADIRENYRAYSAIFFSPVDYLPVYILTRK